MPAPSQPSSESESQVEKVTPAGCENEMIPGKVGDQDSTSPPPPQVVILAQRQDGKLCDLT